MRSRQAWRASGAGLRLLAVKDITPLEGGLPSSSTAQSSARSASPARRWRARKAARNLDFYTHVIGLRFVKKTVNFDDPGT
jgi:hypothetical protein